MFPFDWMNWEGVLRYRENPAALATAPVGDAVRLLTAIQRAERFGDGNIEGALESGPRYGEFSFRQVHASLKWSCGGMPAAIPEP